MRVDLAAYSAAIGHAQRVLDALAASGIAEHAGAAEVLRRDTPAVMRLASGAQDRHDAMAREPKPTTEIIPQTDAITRTKT